MSILNTLLHTPVEHVYSLSTDIQLYVPDVYFQIRNVSSNRSVYLYNLTLSVAYLNDSFNLYIPYTQEPEWYTL